MREHLDFAQAQVEYLQNTLGARDRELAEMRRLLAGALERIPQLLHPPPEASPEPRESPETTSKNAGKDEAPDVHTEEPHRRSWWSRLFGLPE
jgi:hypothetical protein